MRHSDIVRSLLLAAILLAAGTAAAASASEDAASDEEDWVFEDPLVDGDSGSVVAVGERDPFESWNRDVFAFNRRIDRWVFDPVTRGYRFVMPEPGRRAVYRFSLNLDTPVVLANHMLQFRVVEAAGAATRFVLNTAFGLGGLFDPAESFFEVPRVDADFGQTLARYGSPSGPYLMLPVFGPSTVRDVFGDLVDILADPVTYLLGPFQWWTLALGGSEGLIVREANFDDLKNLEAGSIDFYAALRSAYLQTRDAAVKDARGARASSDVVMRAF